MSSSEIKNGIQNFHPPCRPEPIVRTKSILLSVGLWTLLANLGCPVIASAQIATISISQNELRNLEPAKQMEILNSAILKAGGPWARSCKVTKTEFIEAQKKWLARCAGGHDFLILITENKGVISLNCTLSKKTSGIGCYSNITLTLPQAAEECVKSQEPEMIVKACTVVIESRRFDGSMLGSLLQIRGGAYSELSDGEAAIADFNTAIQATPNNSSFWYNRATFHQRQKQYVASIPDYDEAIRLKPDHPEAYNGRGFSYLQQHIPDKAIQDFDKAISLNRRDARALRNRAAAYREKGDSARAEADLMESKKIDATNQAIGQ
jgi:tetratricopeptide (TPR) repeat protein